MAEAKSYDKAYKEQAVKLAKKIGGKVAAVAFVIELDALEGRQKFPEGVEIVSMVHC